MCKLIRRALEFGRVCIITNAETGWVELSARRFMPAVERLLCKVKVISARSKFEMMYPDSPLEWKVAAFHCEVREGFAAACDYTRDRHVLSFGDSIHERDAVHRVAGDMPNTNSKSVKFVERPTLEHLRRQVQLVHSCFDYICNYAGDLDLMLTIQVLQNGEF